MNKVTVRAAILGGLTLLSGLTAASAGAAVKLPFGTRCEGTSARVHVNGFKDRVGNIRIQVYGGDPDEFLASGKYLVRVQGPVPTSGPVETCVPLPGPGTYALVALHDRNMDGKVSISSDGVAFSRNPKLGLSKPDFDKVKVTMPAGITDFPLVLNYRRGLFSIGPVSGSN